MPKAQPNNGMHPRTCHKVFATTPARKYFMPRSGWSSALDRQIIMKSIIIYFTALSLSLLGCNNINSQNVQISNNENKLSLKYSVQMNGSGSQIKLNIENGLEYAIYTKERIRDDDLSFVGSSNGADVLLNGTCVLIIPYQILPNNRMHPRPWHKVYCYDASPQKLYAMVRLILGVGLLNSPERQGAF